MRVYILYLRMRVYILYLHMTEFAHVGFAHIILRMWDLRKWDLRHRAIPVAALSQAHALTHLPRRDSCTSVTSPLRLKYPPYCMLRNQFRKDDNLP